MQSFPRTQNWRVELVLGECGMTLLVLTHAELVRRCSWCAAAAVGKLLPNLLGPFLISRSMECCICGPHVDILSPTSPEDRRRILYDVTRAVSPTAPRYDKFWTKG